MKLRLATTDDIATILHITDAARLYQRQLGFTQWTDGYPDRGIIEADIANANAYVLTVDGVIAAYAVLTVGDSDYDMLDDTWLYEGQYGVIHRMAISPHVRGTRLSGHLFGIIEEKFRTDGIRVIRVDTGVENHIMQHILSKLQYQLRGTRTFTWGVRLAYEKSL